MENSIECIAYQSIFWLRKFREDISLFRGNTLISLDALHKRLAPAIVTLWSDKIVFETVEPVTDPCSSVKMNPIYYFLWWVLK